MATEKDFTGAKDGESITIWYHTWVTSNHRVGGAFRGFDKQSNIVTIEVARRVNFGKVLTYVDAGPLMKKSAITDYTPSAASQSNRQEYPLDAIDAISWDDRPAVLTPAQQKQRDERLAILARTQFVVNLNDPSRFYTITDDQWQPQQCPSGQIFNPQTKSTDSPWSVEIPVRANIYDGETFYLIIENELVLQPCPPGEAYDPAIRTYPPK